MQKNPSKQIFGKIRGARGLNSLAPCDKWKGKGKKGGSSINHRKQPTRERNHPGGREEKFSFQSRKKTKVFLANTKPSYWRKGIHNRAIPSHPGMQVPKKEYGRIKLKNLHNIWLWVVQVVRVATFDSKNWRETEPSTAPQSQDRACREEKKLN